MDEFIGVVSVVAVIVAVLGGLAGFAVLARRRGVRGPVLGVFDELYHPRAHSSHIEIQVHDNEGTPAPAPGGP